MADPALPRRFPIRIERRYQFLLRLFFGVREELAWVDVGENLEARFGWVGMVTPVGNCVRWSIEGPWRALTAVGVRRGNRDGDITFGGSARGGVRIDFRERPRIWKFRPPALYVTVEDLEGFASALRDRGIPGEDRRRPGR